MNTLNVEEAKLAKAYLIVKGLEASTFGWISATYVLFLLEKGLTPEQTTQVNTFFMVGNFFFDLPTGALGDMVGQLPVYLAGLCLLALGYTLYGIGSSFWAFVLCESISAIGTALMSEALESLLTNRIGVDRAKAVFSREGVVRSMAMVPTTLAGSWIAATYGLAIPWFLGGLTTIVAVVFGITTLKGYHTKPNNGDIKKLGRGIGHFISTVKVGTRIVFSKKETRLVLLVSGVVAAATQALNMFWAPVLKEQSGSSWWLGIMWVGIAGTTAIGSHIAKKLKPGKRTFSVLLICIGIPLMLIYILPKYAWLTSLLFLSHEIGRGAIPIVLYAYLNKFIPNQQRTTANSAKGSMDRLFRAVGLLTAGVLSTQLGLTGTWFVSGIALVILAISITILSTE